MEYLIYWICETAFCASGIIYMYTMERREYFGKRILGWIVVFTLLSGIINSFLPNASVAVMNVLHILGYGILVLFARSCWNISWSVAIYQSIWAVMSWQLLFEVWIGIRRMEIDFWAGMMTNSWIVMVLIFFGGYTIAAFTIARWMPDGEPKRLGPRQLISAILIFGTFEMLALTSANRINETWNGITIYLSQLLLALILYLQNELFKKSAMRQELAVMNMLWKKEQEQYQLSKENIALINQKCHDLKHQIRAIRNSSKEEMDKYLEEMEGSIRIYESIVKTGNEVLDTILTEKSLYCKDRGIIVSCVADGSQMDFINTVDLYAILGNALDNAIEAVEKFKHTEKRQIDVLIYRQQNFLVMNIINPIKGNLVYEEDLPVSTKGDNRFHGFGLRSMRYIVKKYDGFLNISAEDGCFSLKILIPIPQEK